MYILYSVRREMGRLSIRLTIKKLNIYLSKTHSLHSKMTYIAFFLLVGRSLLRFFNSCSPFLLSVGDSFMPLRPSVHLCAFSLWGWIRWTSVSLLWLRRCCSCLSGCFIPLTQRYCSGPEMPVCTGVPCREKSADGSSSSLWEVLTVSETHFFSQLL